MIRFVSNLPRDLRTGGFSAMNAAAYAALAQSFELTYVGPVNPPVSFAEKVISRALRLAGAPGDYYFFSERRLSAIAAEVAQGEASGARLDFFHGLTPWIATAQERPYVAWSDCTFADYIDIYHDRTRFRTEDLSRIERREARWLRGARRVLFTSDWAARRAIEKYELNPGRVGSVGIFGEQEPPSSDTFAGGACFAFISTNFGAKGGPTALAALRILRQTHPHASLTIIGAPPAGGAIEPGVSYSGFLRKEVPQENELLRTTLATSVAVVHPTRSDIAPLILVEAAMFGCPAIAPRAYAIPELVVDGESGLLLEPNADAEALAAAMRRLLDYPELYAALRSETWRRGRAFNTRAQFAQRLCGHVAAASLESNVAAA